MKHKLIVLCSLVAVFALGVATMNTYDNHKVKVQAQTKTETAAAQQRFVKDSLKINALEQSNLKLQTQCQSFASVYSQIPLVVRAKLDKPDCTTAQ